MKQKDLVHYGNICALHAMCHYMSELLDDMDGDLPEMLDDEYQSLRASINYMMEGITKYHIAEVDTFVSACED